MSVVSYSNAVGNPLPKQPDIEKIDDKKADTITDYENIKKNEYMYNDDSFVKSIFNTIFELKKLRNFDRDWFSSTYCFFASHFNSNTSETA